MLHLVGGGGMAEFQDLSIGPEVIEGLGEEAGDVDAVSGGEAHVGIEVSIHESGLDEPLAVVKDAIDLDGGDIASECGELAFLDGRDLALGVEDVNVDALDTEESVGDGRARVARGGDEYVDRLVCPLIGLDEVLQQSRHEAGPYVLEGEGRAVE